METLNDSTENNMAPARPEFLKVLCILSFVGIGIVLLMSLAGLPKLFQSPEMRMAEMEKMEQISPGFMEKMAPILGDPNYTAKAVSKFCIDLLFQVLSLIGVLQMWKLRKRGFYIYMAGELLPYVTSLIFADQSAAIINSLPQTIAKIAYVVIGIFVIFDLVFIFMYSRNLKYMK
ncbi:MAG: hypothetical protein ACJ76F_06770 [Bacteroidia bacterium]